MTEEVTVSSRVSELQTTNGERSFALENAALTNIANNGRQLFNFATLVPGALPQGTSGQEVGSVSGFTVNGMRPNSNNMTIDGVANIDTGDNGGNMATTNIDAVAEFKVLTNSYAAEYGRATGAQVQVVTKSGSREFHGSGYWYGRRSDWNANSWTNKRVTPEIPKVKANRNDGGYTVGGPVFFPGFNEEKKKLFFFFSQEYQRRARPRCPARARPASRPRSSVRATSRRAWTRAATRSPRSVTTPQDCPAAPPTLAAASRTAACSGRFQPIACISPASLF